MFTRKQYPIQYLLGGLSIMLFLHACGGGGSSSSSDDDRPSTAANEESCAAVSDSATFRLATGSTTTLLMNGTIDCTTNDKLQSALNANAIDTIIMEEVGGSEDDDANIAMSTTLSGQSINTEVAENGLIASGGVDFFLAGITRKINQNSLVGVHSWASSDGREGIDVYNSDPNNAEHSVYITYYDQFVKELKDGRPSNSITNIATDFYVYTLEAAPSSGIHCMTAAELIAWGIVTNTTVAADLNPVIFGSSHTLASTCTH